MIFRLRIFSCSETLHDYTSFLQNLPKNYRVVLVKNWTEGAAWHNMILTLAVTAVTTEASWRYRN